MKLQDIQADVVSVVKQLQEKYNVGVTATVKSNPDNLSEIVLTFNVSTTQRVVDTEAVVPEVVETKTKRTRKKKEVVTEEATNA